MVSGVTAELNSINPIDSLGVTISKLLGPAAIEEVRVDLSAVSCFQFVAVSTTHVGFFPCRRQNPLPGYMLYVCVKR